LYIFFLDIAGSMQESNVEAAVTAVRRKCQWFKPLGSYPVRTAAEG
jgi:prephenate dehydratase